MPRWPGRGSDGIEGPDCDRGGGGGGGQALALVRLRHLSARISLPEGPPGPKLKAYSGDQRGLTA